MNFKTFLFPCSLIGLMLLANSCNVQKITNHTKYIFDGDSVFENRSWKISSSNFNIETEFLYPTPSKAIAGKFERFEIGLVLPEQISAEVDEFLNNPDRKYPNPYDPEHINVEAFFSNGKDTLRSYGFYFMDYDRNLQTNNSWKEKFTDYNWRIRFAPPSTGNWNCDIKISFPNSDIQPIYKKNIRFKCVEKSRTGFITIADDHRHFKFVENDSSFFAIGQNISWTDAAFFKGRWLNGSNSEFNFKNKNFRDRLFSIGYMDLNGYMENVAKNHGNMVRVISWHDSYLFEWEERGVYGSNRNPQDANFLRQKRAWELDQLFSSAESNNIKLLFCLEFQGQYNYDWNGGKEVSYYQNPYNHVVKDGKIELKQPQDFYADPILREDYKKKLRYFIARWGYSASLGIFQLANEFDGWASDSTAIDKRLYDIIRVDAGLQKDLLDWHNHIGIYLDTIAYRPIIFTSGLMGNTRPTDIPKSRNFYMADGIDMVIHNQYGNDRSQNYIMNQNAQKYLKTFDKPFMFTETGIITDPTKNADPNDVDGCDDVMFHNFLWAGTVMGSAGGSLNWWQPFDNKRRENFVAAHSFFSKIDFQSKSYKEQDYWTDKGLGSYFCGNLKTLINRKGIAEVYYVRTSKKDKLKLQGAFGWAHNLTHYWANLESYTKCPDRNDQLIKVKCCGEDTNSVPVTIDTNIFKIKIKGLKPKTFFQINWYSTTGNGDLIKTLTLQANGSGVINLFWPGPDFDYAFKLEEIQVDVLEKKQ